MAEIEKAVANSLLLGGRSIDLQGGGDFIDYPVNAVCQSASKNLYGVDIDTLGLSTVWVSSGNYYAIQDNGSENLSPEKVKDYMELMTGIRFIPDPVTTKFNGAMFWTNGSISYMTSVDNSDGTYKLRMVRVTSDSFTTRSDVENIIDEIASPVTSTDLSGQTTTTTSGIGLTIQNTSDGSSVSGTKVTLVDTTEDNN